MRVCSYDVYAAARALATPCRGADDDGQDFRGDWLLRRRLSAQGARLSRFARLAVTDVQRRIPPRSRVHICRDCRCCHDAGHEAAASAP